MGWSAPCASCNADASATPADIQLPRVLNAFFLANLRSQLIRDGD